LVACPNFDLCIGYIFHPLLETFRVKQMSATKTLFKKKYFPPENKTKSLRQGKYLENEDAYSSLLLGELVSFT
jgi:hypothetical protein